MCRFWKHFLCIILTTFDHRVWVKLGYGTSDGQIFCDRNGCLENGEIGKEVKPWFCSTCYEAFRHPNCHVEDE